MIDSHVHVADVPTARPVTVGRDWWSDGRASTEHLVAALDAADVERAVIVQAVGPHGYDNSYAAAAVTAHPDRFALVAAVEPGEPAPDGCAGVRLFGVAGDDTWLHDGRGAATWATSPTIVATLFRDALPRLRPLVEANPDVPVALDHCGFPDGDLGPVLALADLPAVHLKVSSHVLAPEPDPAAFVARLADAYGWDRLCWGSDHPQHGGDYAALVELGRRAAAGNAEFLDGTARRLWFD